MGSLRWTLLFCTTFVLSCGAASVGNEDEWNMNLDVNECVGEAKSFKHGAVAADNPFCSSIGRYFLEKGGSVVDAAVGIHACQTVADIHLTGFGGGGRILFYNRTEQKTYHIDGAYKSYNNIPENLFQKAEFNNSKKMNGRFVAIPGNVAALWEAHQKFGILEWKQLFQPAIKLARNGVPINEFMWKAIRERPYPRVLVDEMLKSIFVDNKTGDVRKQGEVVKFPLLAKTLERVAEGGRDVFYNGSLAEDIVKDINYAGGLFTLDDMRNYKAKETETISTTFKGAFRGLTAHNAPGSSGGIFLQFQLLLLDSYKDISPGLDEATMQHRIMDTARLAFCFYSQLGGSAVNVEQIMKRMLDPKIAEALRRKLRDDVSVPYPTICEEPEFDPPKFKGTSHFSLIGPNGDALAMTSSIHNYLGSTVMGKRTGLSFNDGICDFYDPMCGYCTWVDHGNLLKPNARPRTLQTPTIFTDERGDVQLVTGASGGSKIVMSVLSLAVNTLLRKVDVKAATDKPRIYSYRIGTGAYMPGVPENIIAELRKRGHSMTEFDDGIRESCVQSVLVKDGHLFPYSDTRRQGCTDGF